MLDGDDNCETEFNPKQVDRDGNSVGNVCDANLCRLRAARYVTWADVRVIHDDGVRIKTPPALKGRGGGPTIEHNANAAYREHLVAVNVILSG